MREITTTEIKENVFKQIGKDWMLVGATKDGKSNAMTASWGGLGVMWGADVAFVFIRETRYTKEFVDATDKMSLSFFGDDAKEMLSYMGKVSGRDEDKIDKMNFHLVDGYDAPVFEEAKMTFLCKKLYAQEMTAESFTDKEQIDKWYADGNYHTMYVVKIESVIVND